MRSHQNAQDRLRGVQDLWHLGRAPRYERGALAAAPGDPRLSQQPGSGVATSGHVGIHGGSMGSLGLGRLNLRDLGFLMKTIGRMEKIAHVLISIVDFEMIYLIVQHGYSILFLYVSL